MDYQLREYYVARICSGFIKLKVRHHDGSYLLFHKPTLDQKYYAEEIYVNVYNEALSQNNWMDDELENFMYSAGLWSSEKETKLKTLEENLNKLKTRSLTMTFKSDELKKVKEAIKVTKHEIKKLEDEKSSLNFLSCSGVASIARSKYLIGCSLFYNRRERVFKSNKQFWRSDSTLLQDAMQEYLAKRLHEPVYRELARTEPWRNIWSLRDCEKALFNVPVVDYTDEQRSLAMWTRFYDNIFEHPERPTTSVINDDDLMDGWVILQREKADKSENLKSADDLIKNDKVRNSQEVYLVAGSESDAKRIEDLNDDVAKSIKKSRMKKLFEEGTVNELDMPDTKRRLRAEAIEHLRSKMKSI